MPLHSHRSLPLVDCNAYLEIHIFYHYLVLEGCQTRDTATLDRLFRR